MSFKSTGTVTSLGAWKARKGDPTIEGNFGERQLFTELYMGAVAGVDEPSPGAEEFQEADSLRARARRLHLLGVPLPVRIIQPGFSEGDVAAEVIEVNFGGHDEF
jgi:hypothetical protein